MPTIVIVSAAPERLSAFTRSLQSTAGAPVTLAATAGAALEMARNRHTPPVLMVIDPSVDRPVLDLVKEILSANALINTAVISDQPEAVFHDIAEGLGILMQLPDPPGPADGAALRQRLVDIGAVIPPA